MKRELNGAELAEFIKERQAKAVRGLIQHDGVKPKLAIIQTKDDPVIATYVRLKKRYGDDIQIDVVDYIIDQDEARATIDMLNNDESVHGIIVQLPLQNIAETDEIVSLVAPNKDVDALGAHALYDPATPLAINWLLAGYNIELRDRKIVLIGKGKLVGAPLFKQYQELGYDVTVLDRSTEDISEEVLSADIIITATGTPGIIHSDMISHEAVVVDAGVASESGKTAGDLDADVYARDDLILTPVRGGVGPLTVCALFENVITAARNSISS
jgi:methylenetetrahydrofolate dehydrogenase (NADP+)/methenyltetrahydrofolate cyclohydrolase